MNIEKLQQIIDNGGYLSKETLTDVAKTFPRMKVVIKWEYAPRELTEAEFAPDRIQRKEGNGDYAREVFLPYQVFDEVKEIMQKFNKFK